MIMTLTTWNLLDFRVTEKEKLLEHICSRSPGDHDCGQLVLQLVVFRKYEPKTDWTNCPALTIRLL